MGNSDNDGRGNQEDAGDDGASPHCEAEEEDRSACTSKAFIAMAHLFEAAAIQHLPPERNSKGVFLTEIYEMIFAYVDEEEWKACMRVSRKFR